MQSAVHQWSHEAVKCEHLGFGGGGASCDAPASAASASSMTGTLIDIVS